MSLSMKQAIFAVNVSHLIRHINEQGCSVTFGEAYRTPEQAAINAKKGIGIANSLHCKRLAVDFNLFKDGVYTAAWEDYKPFGEYWESLNTLNRWGGNFAKLRDSVHFEMQEG